MPDWVVFFTYIFKKLKSSKVSFSQNFFGFQDFIPLENISIIVFKVKIESLDYQVIDF